MSTSEFISVASALHQAYRTIFSLGCERDVISFGMSLAMGQDKIKFLVKPHYFDYLARTYRLPVTTERHRTADHRFCEWGGCIFESVDNINDTVAVTVAMMPEMEIEI